jgi:hypothetical protein
MGRRATMGRAPRGAARGGSQAGMLRAERRRAAGGGGVAGPRQRRPGAVASRPAPGKCFFFLFSFLLQKFFTIFFIWIFLGFGCNFFIPSLFFVLDAKKSYLSFFFVLNVKIFSSIFFKFVFQNFLFQFFSHQT